MDREEFDCVTAGDLVYVHDPMPPSYSLLLGDVLAARRVPRVLSVYLPQLDRTVYAEPNRVHSHPLREEDQRACPLCRLASLTRGVRNREDA